MNFKDLSRPEQKQVRRLMRDQMRSTTSQPYPRVAKLLVSDEGGSLQDPQLLEEIRTLWRAFEGALTGDFVLRESVANWVEAERTRAATDHAAADQLLGPCPDDATAERLRRRIHNQRIALSLCDRLLKDSWKRALLDWRGGRQWQDGHVVWLKDEAQKGTENLRLLAQLRRQRRELRRAHRIIEAQHSELGALVDRVVRQAATG